MVADTPAREQQEAAPAEATTNGQAQKPKKAVSAYWIFSSKVREEVTKEIKDKNQGKASLGDIAKATTARWAAMSEEDKKEFEDKAAEDKKRYAEEFKAYLEASDPAGTLRTKYAHLIPKKPLTAYFLFSQEPAQREKATAALKEAGVEASNKQVTAKLAEMWKAASAEEKGAYEERHKREQEEFLKKQMAWQATPEFKEIEEAAKKQAEQQQQQQKEEGQEASPSKGTKRSRSAAKTPNAKEAKGEKEAKEAKSEKAEAQQGPASAAKRPRKSVAAKEEPQVSIDADVLAEASKAGLEGMLKNLASRAEVVAAGKTSREIFKALQASGGLVNPAKRALIGAAGA